MTHRNAPLSIPTLGLRWSDVDLDRRALTVSRARVDVNGRSVVGKPKTARGARTLPMPDDLAGAPQTMRIAQVRVLGSQSVEEGHLAVNAAGEPIRSEFWTDAWRRHCAEAGVAPVSLHAAVILRSSCCVTPASPTISSPPGMATTSWSCAGHTATPIPRNWRSSDPHLRAPCRVRRRRRTTDRGTQSRGSCDTLVTLTSVDLAFWRLPAPELRAPPTGLEPVTLRIDLDDLISVGHRR